MILNYVCRPCLQIRLPSQGPGVRPCTYLFRDIIQSTTLSFLLCKMGDGKATATHISHSQHVEQPARRKRSEHLSPVITPHPSRCRSMKPALSCAPVPFPHPNKSRCLHPFSHGLCTPLQLFPGPGGEQEEAGSLCQPIGSFRLKNWILFMSL